MLKSLIRASLIVGALAVPAFFVSAQAQARPNNQGMPGKAQASSAQSIDVSDAEVHQFAALFMKISSIRMTYGQKLRAAKDKSEAQKIKKQGSAAVQKALGKSPLSAKRYNRIAKATASNPDLKKRLMAEINKLKAQTSKNS